METISISVKGLPLDVWREFKILAIQKGTTTRELVIELVDAYIKKEKEPTLEIIREFVKKENEKTSNKG